MSQLVLLNERRRGVWLKKSQFQVERVVGGEEGRGEQ
jgi:hypothetical protein